jgi:hypothetical protein
MLRKNYYKKTWGTFSITTEDMVRRDVTVDRHQPELQGMREFAWQLLSANK